MVVNVEPAACALLASPKQASAMPARLTPNFFSAPRRVTDWARLLVSSSNLLFMFFLSFGVLRWLSRKCSLHLPKEDARNVVRIDSTEGGNKAAAHRSKAEIVAEPITIDHERQAFQIERAARQA